MQITRKEMPMEEVEPAPGDEGKSITRRRLARVQA